MNGGPKDSPLRRTPVRRGPIRPPDRIAKEIGIIRPRGRGVKKKKTPAGEGTDPTSPLRERSQLVRPNTTPDGASGRVNISLRGG